MTPTLSKDTRRGPGARRRVLVVVRPAFAGIVAGDYRGPAGDRSRLRSASTREAQHHSKLKSTHS